MSLWRPFIVVIRSQEEEEERRERMEKIRQTYQAYFQCSLHNDLTLLISRVPETKNKLSFSALLRIRKEEEEGRQEEGLSVPIFTFLSLENERKVETRLQRRRRQERGGKTQDHHHRPPFPPPPPSINLISWQGDQS